MHVTTSLSLHLNIPQLKQYLDDKNTRRPCFVNYSLHCMVASIRQVLFNIDFSGKLNSDMQNSEYF
jgi:hypothetical protein